jgi:hypothetical protein
MSKKKFPSAEKLFYGKAEVILTVRLDALLDKLHDEGDGGRERVLLPMNG